MTASHGQADDRFIC